MKIFIHVVRRKIYEEEEEEAIGRRSRRGEARSVVTFSAFVPGQRSSVVDHLNRIDHDEENEQNIDVNCSHVNGRCCFVSSKLELVRQAKNEKDFYIGK